MKRPIKPEDIRKGDLIRFEYGDDDRADEYRAGCDGDGWVSGPEYRRYLLDRPTPPVELPTEPTLGWLDVSRLESPTSGPGSVLAFVRNRGTVVDADPHGGWSIEFVTAFTPAVAVPKAALDELCEAIPADDAEPEWMRAAGKLRQRIDDFLAAVDAANGGDPE